MFMFMAPGTFGFICAIGLLSRRPRVIATQSSKAKIIHRAMHRLDGQSLGPNCYSFRLLYDIRF